MTNFIFVTAQKEMLHKYPRAPKPVAFLRNLHRHIFHFKVSIQVFHNDRELEFIIFKNNILTWMREVLNPNMDACSCEMISDLIADKIKTQYPKRHIKIEVSEDGENGVLMDYPLDKIYCYDCSRREPHTADNKCNANENDVVEICPSFIPKGPKNK